MLELEIKSLREAVETLSSNLEALVRATQPVEDKPVEDKPVEYKPVEDKPVEDKPVEDKPVEDKVVEDKPVEDKPVEDKPKKRKRRTKAEIEAEKQAEEDLAADEPQAVEEDEPVTLTDLQDLVMGKVRSDRTKKSQIVKILEGFGVKNISSLDEKHYVEVKAAVEKI